MGGSPPFHLESAVMSLLRPSRLLAAAAGLALAVGVAGSAAASPCPDPNAGPPYDYTTELVGQFGRPIPLKDMALLRRTALGYQFEAGPQNTHLTVTEVSGRIRFADTHSASWRSLPKSCRTIKVTKGISASCRIPSWVTDSQPLLVEIWPRLGNDYLDAHTLPASVSMTMLADEGDDTARFGAGRDFFNGYLGHDRVWGGAGNDWLRPGRDSDLVRGGAGNDYIVGGPGADSLYGDDGSDFIAGSSGNDTIDGGSDTGIDAVYCGTGTDSALINVLSRATGSCETITQQ